MLLRWLSLRGRTGGDAILMETFLPARCEDLGVQLPVVCYALFRLVLVHLFCPQQHSSPNKGECICLFIFFSFLPPTWFAADERLIMMLHYAPFTPFFGSVARVGNMKVGGCKLSPSDGVEQKEGLCGNTFWNTKNPSEAPNKAPQFIKRFITFK